IKFNTNGNDYEIGARGSSADNPNNFYIYDNNANSYRMLINSNGAVSILGDLDVDGHTNLDNVSIAGVSTISNHLFLQKDAAYIDFKQTDGTQTGYIQSRTTGFRFNSYGARPVKFGTNDVERVRITSGGDIQVDNGNLHIDDNGEFAIFEQDTSLAMTNSSKISMDFASNVARIRSSHNGSGGNAVSRPLAFFIGSSEKVRITSDGKVGIGTNIPLKQLHVFKSNEHPVMFERGDTSNTIVELKTNGATRGYWGCSTTANFMVYDNDASDINFIVNQDGRIQIGNGSGVNASAPMELQVSSTSAWGDYPEHITLVDQKAYNAADNGA
ncbi:MAG: hypothetical protein VXY93_12685, partial [Pseudomonadota bacterium]|nr:hypothetical protein [Pseudomonadota bacterium]